MKKISFDVVYLLILIILLFLLKLNVLRLPYFWDDFNYVIPAVDYVFREQITPFLWEYGLGHPPFFYIFSGIIFRVFGDSLIVSHLIILIFSFLSLFFTYLIGKELFNRKIGVLSSLVLLFTPIFFSFSGLFNLEMPLTAFIIMATYFSIKNKHLLYALFGSLAVLTKETAIGAVLAIFIIKLIKEKDKLEILKFYYIPLVAFLLWILSNKFYYGHFLFPISTSIIITNPIKNVFNLLIVLKILFFDDFRWILSLFFFLQFISIKQFKTFKKIYVKLIISILFFLFLFNLKNIIPKYYEYFPNIDIYLELMRNFSLFYAAIFFIILISFDKIKAFVLERKYWEIFILILTFIGMHSLVIPVTPRYLLPIIPVVLLISTGALYKIFRKYTYLIVLLFIIISMLQFYGESSKVGFALENNLEHQDFIKVRQMGASHIETNFPNSTILTTFPLSLDLTHPYGKYVRNKLDVITIDHYGGLTNKNYTQFLYPETIPERNINLNEIDLYYHSPQEFPTKEVYDIRDKLDLTLIKKFELNNKSVEIYKVEGIKAS